MKPDGRILVVGVNGSVCAAALHRVGGTDAASV
jgi:hypothetical protein